MLVEGLGCFKSILVGATMINNKLKEIKVSGYDSTTHLECVLPFKVSFNSPSLDPRLSSTYCMFFDSASNVNENTGHISFHNESYVHFKYEGNIIYQWEIPKNNESLIKTSNGFIPSLSVFIEKKLVNYTYTGVNDYRNLPEFNYHVFHFLQLKYKLNSNNVTRSNIIGFSKNVFNPKVEIHPEYNDFIKEIYYYTFKTCAINLEKNVTDNLKNYKFKDSNNNKYFFEKIKNINTMVIY